MSGVAAPRRDARPISVNLFEMACVGHISHGLWVHPDNTRHRFNDLDFWTVEARLLEEGLVDAVFLADVVGAYDTYRGGPETALREAVQIPSNDPLLLVPAMAAVTQHLGFAATFSTTYEPPFAFARRASTLDHLTKGRFGWNVVTSYLPNAARNFGLAQEVEHDTRYAIAEEYLDVLYKLWEGSWDDDAVVQDREQRVYTDPSKVRYVDHVGEHFSVAGPHLVQPSPQRTPVIFQAGSSPAGRAFAARHAEGVFVGGYDLASYRETVADIRRQAAQHGRDPRADVRHGRRHRRAHAGGGRAQGGRVRPAVPRGGLPGPRGGRRRRPRGVPAGHLDERRARGRGRGRADLDAADPVPPHRRHRPGRAPGRDALRPGPVLRGGHAVAGGRRDAGVGGRDRPRRLQPAPVPHPRHGRGLRRAGRAGAPAAGLYRTRYEESTLRERLFGAGRTRVPASHPAARYRGGAHLGPGAGTVAGALEPLGVRG